MVTSDPGAGGEIDVRVRVRGSVPDAQRERAVEKLVAALEAAPRPVITARIELLEEENRALERPAVVKAAADVSGNTIRAHIARPTMEEAVDLAVARIHAGVLRLAERWETRKHETGIAEPGEWRHGDVPTARPHHFPRPPSEREVVRRKSFAVERISPEEAAFEMEQLDHDVHVFREASTGSECAIRGRPDGMLELVSADPDVGRGPQGEPAELPVVPAPTMALADALQMLDVTDGPPVVFVDAESGRLSVAYLRYDGHYGLVTAS